MAGELLEGLGGDAPASPVAFAMVDTLLRENTLLEAAILENLQLGRLREGVVYLERLQRNLIGLSRLRDLQSLTSGSFPVRPLPLPPAQAFTRHQFAVEAVVAGMVAHEVIAPSRSPYSEPSAAVEAEDTRGGAAGVATEGGGGARGDEGDGMPRWRQQWDKEDERALLRACAAHGEHDTALLARCVFGPGSAHWEGASSAPFVATSLMRRRIRNKLVSFKRKFGTVQVAARHML
jgi:hypothetical protein